MAKNTADIGFEKQIWDAACVLRGNMDASEYKNVVLGLIFLKYISDRFDDKYQELKDEGDGFEEDIDEYTSEGIDCNSNLMFIFCNNIIRKILIELAGS